VGYKKAIEKERISAVVVVVVVFCTELLTVKVKVLYLLLSSLFVSMAICSFIKGVGKEKETRLKISVLDFQRQELFSLHGSLQIRGMVGQTDRTEENRKV
jgi:hypothetical protein